MQPNPQQMQQQQPSPKDMFEQAKKLIAVGDIFEASKRAGKLRAHFPEEAPILAMHGLTLAKLGVYAPAIMDMQTAAALTKRALDEGEDDMPARPRVVDQYLNLQAEIGRCFVAMGEYEEAQDAIDLALEMDEEHANSVCSFAELHSARGDTDQAIKVLEDAQSNKLDEIPVLVCMAKVLDQAKTPDIERMKSCRDALADLRDEIGLMAGELMELLRAHGTMCDRLGDYSDAFNSFRRAAKQRRGKFNPEAHAKITSKLIETWTAQGIDSTVRAPENIAESRVILCGSVHSGMPEIQVLLERLPNVVVIGPIESLGHLCATHMNAVQGTLRMLVPTPTGHRGDQLAKVAGGYIRQCDSAARMSGMTTVDTHPHNIMLAGAAAMALKGVRIINCRRDPLEHALSIYCDEMPGNHAYSADLISAASFVKDSDRLMDHWTSVLNEEQVGAKVINVQFDQLHSDPVAVLRQLGAAIGLEVSDAMATGIEPTEPKGPGSHPSEYSTAHKQLKEFFAS